MQLSQQFSKPKPQNYNEISLYDGEPATEKLMQSEVRKLAAAFPEVTTDFLIVLIERLIDNQFTKERVKDAINNLIDNSPYKRPSIADIISFDRKIKLFTYNEIQEKCTPTYHAFEKYKCVEVEGRKRYIEI